MRNQLNIDYEQTINFLFSQLPMYQRQGKAAYKANLDNTNELDSYLNHPHQKYKTIHIAGTNGKGSVSHMLASIFQSAGYKTGLYTSPHLVDFRERIKINGELVSKKFVVDFVKKHTDFFSKLKPSFFELTVIMAFEYFAQENIDIAIIEVGMGGRLDSTNIISPELSIITNIGLDHTQFLGDSLAKIAGEKAGIIKTQIPVLIGEYTSETKTVFEKKAKELNSALFFADNFYSLEYALQNINETQTIHIKDLQTSTKKEFELDLLGHYQHKNILTTLSAINLIQKKFTISNNMIVEGLKNVIKNTELLGRWQIINRNPLTICDTGHNSEGLKEIVSQIFKYPFKKLHIIFGTVDDKNTDKILSLLPKEANYYFTKASIPRALNQNKLAKNAESYGLKGNTYETVEKAFLAAKNEANKNDFIFIGGSTFIVGDLLSLLNSNLPTLIR